MYCIFCGKENEYPACEKCGKDEVKINAAMDALSKESWSGKSMSWEEEEKGKEHNLYYLPDYARKTTLELLTKEFALGAKACKGFGIYAIVEYEKSQGPNLGRTAIVSERLMPPNLELYQRKMLLQSISQHFKEMANLTK